MKLEDVEAPDPEKAAEEARKFFTFLGVYISTFQHIEAKLDQIIQLAIGHERFTLGHIIVSELSNRGKINVVRSIVLSKFSDLKENSVQQWIERFLKVLIRCQNEAERRNRIVHSTYLFEFMEIGHPPLRSKRKLTKNGFQLDHEDFDPEMISTISKELAELAFDVGQIHVQLVHWSEALWAPDHSE